LIREKLENQLAIFICKMKKGKINRGSKIVFLIGFGGKLGVGGNAHTHNHHVPTDPPFTNNREEFCLNGGHRGDLSVLTRGNATADI
jgi:hypothetical protein